MATRKSLTDSDSRGCRTIFRRFQLSNFYERLIFFTIGIFIFEAVYMLNDSPSCGIEQSKVPRHDPEELRESFTRIHQTELPQHDDPEALIKTVKSVHGQTEPTQHDPVELHATVYGLHQTKVSPHDDPEKIRETANSVNKTEPAQTDPEVIQETVSDVHNTTLPRNNPENLHEIFPTRSKEESKHCVKRIHIFSNFELFKHVDELKYFKYALWGSSEPGYRSHFDCVAHGFGCNVSLTIGTDLEMLKGKDAVIFGMVGIEWRRNKDIFESVLRLEPEPDQTWIYYSTEPPYRIVRWSETLDITRLKYHVLMTYNSKSDIHIPFGYYKLFNESNPTESRRRKTGDQSVLTDRQGLISWAASNCLDVFWPRASLVSRMRELLQLDDYGTCGHKECLPKRSVKCNRLFASYKFYLAVPNSECDDYITEKFWSTSLLSGVVPVVVGARRKDYERVAPPNSFIHLSDFAGVEEFADYIKRVDQDSALYTKLHSWRENGYVQSAFPLHPQQLCRALPHMRPRSAAELKYVGDSPWYKGCREMPTRETIKSLDHPIDSWSVWK